jgi:LPS O-antigen subunit length determinant protein (WzzB/FepE family)
LLQTDGLSLSAPDSIEQKLNAILQAEQARKEELERERLRVEAEQRFLKEEAERKAAEIERQRRIEAMREAIQVADYDQTDQFVIIGGQRWVLCTRCSKPHKESDMVMIGFPTMNKGRCRHCSRD